MAVQKKVDVVTIGAGWTAAIMAWKLGSAGRKVVSIEQGPLRWANPDYEHNHDGLRYRVRKALMFDLAKETWSWRPNDSLPALPIRQFGSFMPGNGLGGASVHWTAQFWRFLPADFQHYSHNVERYGQDKLPANMSVQDWPLSYADLEPYYDAVDYDIGTAGQVGNLAGQIIPGGNPFEAPRSRPYPLPPNPVSIHAQIFADACRNLGYRPFPQPAGILSEAYKDLSGRTRSGCIYCGFCTRFGCEVDAKTSAVTTHVPAALQTGNWDVRPNSKVLRINTGADGLATGITYIDGQTGEEHEQPADLVLVTGYTLTNVRMLLLSKSKAHPNGIGNDRNKVGKNYTYQILKTPANAIFEGRRFNKFMGNGVIQNLIYEFNADNFDHTEQNFIGGASIYAGSGQNDPLTSVIDMPSLKAGTPGAQSSGGQAEDVQGGATISSEVGSLAHQGNEWGQAWKENMRRNWDGIVGVGIQGEVQAYKQNYLDLDPNYKDAWGQPLLRMTFDFQENEKNLYKFLAARCNAIAKEMNPDRIDFTGSLDPYNVHQYQSTHCTGGAIMGSDPGNSVTNKYGQVWDTPNVFVTGAALYPQNPGANPTGTLLALAYLAGDKLREDYFNNPNELLV